MPARQKLCAVTLWGLPVGPHLEQGMRPWLGVCLQQCFSLLDQDRSAAGARAGSAATGSVSEEQHSSWRQGWRCVLSSLSVLRVCRQLRQQQQQHHTQRPVTVAAGSGLGSA
jgi:hypothetical protein